MSKGHKVWCSQVVVLQGSVRGGGRAAAVRQPGRGAGAPGRGQPGASGLRGRPAQQLFRAGAGSRTGNTCHNNTNMLYRIEIVYSQRGHYSFRGFESTSLERKNNYFVGPILMCIKAYFLRFNA